MHIQGDSGEGWADVGEFELAPRLPDTKLVFPTAPQARHKTCSVLCVDKGSLNVAAMLIAQSASVNAEVHYAQHGDEDEWLV